MSWAVCNIYSRHYVTCMQTLCGVYADAVWYICRHCVIYMQTLCDMYADTVWCVCRNCVMSIRTLCNVYADTVWYVRRHYVKCMRTLCDVNADSDCDVCRHWLYSHQRLPLLQQYEVLWPEVPVWRQRWLYIRRRWDGVRWVRHRHHSKQHDHLYIFFSLHTVHYTVGHTRSYLHLRILHRVHISCLHILLPDN